jgi:hypothetical protein
VVMWHDVIWVEMTCQLDTWHDADLTWLTGKGHGAKIRGDDRWYLSGRHWAVVIGTGSVEKATLQMRLELIAVRICT